MTKPARNLPPLPTVPRVKTIKIDNVTSESGPRAQSIIRALQGQTYMDLQVKFAPTGGSFDVLVETEHADSEDDIRAMVFSLLISEATRTR